MLDSKDSNDEESVLSKGELLDLDSEGSGTGNAKKALKKNILFFFESLSFEQISKFRNQNWDYYLLAGIKDVHNILAKYIQIDHIALIHHGSTYSKKDDAVYLWEFDFAKFGGASTRWHSSAEENASENDFKTFLQEDAETKDYRESEIDAFIAFTKIIRSISNGGAYISVACDEADNPETLYHWAKLTKRSIRLYANSNYSPIDFSEGNARYRYKDEKNNIVSVEFPGSVLNIPLTNIDEFIDKKGWCYVNSGGSDELVVTGKDLILNSIGSNIISLVDHKLFTEKRIAYRHLFYCDAFRDWLIKNRGKAEYSNWVEIAKREI